MKSYSHWWGIVFVPENSDDLIWLKKFPNQIDEPYEDGRIEWITEYEYGNVPIHLPLGKALEILR